MNYTIRDKCIFCNNILDKIYFKNDYNNYIAHYQVDINSNINNHIKIPFNILICSNCKTVQNKYLGDLSEIYKTNHADSTGSTMICLHKLNKDFILKYIDNINNIIEIGSSKGVLADNILDDVKLDYHIIEPSFFGDRSNKIIIDDFYENVDDNNINADTIIISHVFEHFYEPNEILKKISNNKNIKNFFLVWPDLEYYINNNALHVLNTEHTFYVDNDFLIKILESYGFLLKDKIFYNGHSVLFYFNRDDINYEYKLDSKILINFENKNYSLDLFYGNIFKNIEKCNTLLNENINNKKYIWPASIHSLYLFIFGLNENLLDGLLDNSLNKIGKKMYGTELEILSFNKIIEENNENTFIIINGGVFNIEVENQLKDSKIKYLII
jgi:hypothetical protein